MDAAHSALLIIGSLGLAAIAAGAFAVRFGTPILLVFLALGMLAGEDGPGGIRFDDYAATYLAGSVALVAILIEAGLKTSAAAIRRVLAPALALATVGVVLTAAVVGGIAAVLLGVSVPAGLLVGAVVAPTDAAAVAAVLRASGARVPERLIEVLEVESGINDPAAVFLTVLLVQMVLAPETATLGHAATLLAREMAGGAAFGLLGGWLVRITMQRLRVQASLHPVLLLAGGLALFGAAQLLHASGFLAVYLAAVVVGEGAGEHARELERTTEGFAWIAQIALCVLLGLLVNPSEIPPLLLPALALAAALIFLARPVAAVICLAPFGFAWRETAFIGWVGLRGGVPLYLATIPVLERVPGAKIEFVAAFAIVLASLVVQGWTVAPMARWLGLDRQMEPARPHGG